MVSDHGIEKADTMTLTTRQIDAAKPKPTMYKLADAGGLYLAVLTSGVKSWRFNYTDAGKQKTKTYGTSADLTLAEARALHAAFKDAGQAAGAPPFELVARQWFKIKLPTLDNAKHQTQVVNTLERFVFPAIGKRPMHELKRADLVAVVKAIEARDTIETAHRVAGRIGMVFNYAQDAGLIDAHPAAGLARVLQARKVRKHMASIPPAEAGALLAAIAGYEETVTRLGLLLLAHTFVRPTELRTMPWAELRLADDVWVIGADRMKMDLPHVVPLSRQVKALLAELAIITGDAVLALDSPARPNHALSENTFLFALYRLGYRGRMTAHGFRSLASTVLNEQSPFNRDAIERQLAHSETNEVRAAYNRAEYLAERRLLMQWWSDWLDSQSAQSRRGSSGLICQA